MSVSGRSDLIDISGEVRRETDRAVLFFDGKAEVWLPKSQIEVETKGRTLVEVTLPEWLAISTITGAKRGELALVTADGRKLRPGVDVDILYRMLDPEELAGATSLHREDGSLYEFVGNKTEVIKQIGNAVPVEMGKRHIRALIIAAFVTGRRSRVSSPMKRAA